MISVNAFHAAGECRRQVKNVTSTNMPGIGSLIREKDAFF